MALLGEVEQPARGAHDDVGALLQRFDLRFVGAAAVDGDDRQRTTRIGVKVFRRLSEVAVHLDAQFAGGDHHQRAGRAGQRAGAVGVGGDPVQQWHTEGERLTHPGAGLADQVVAGQSQRKGEFLDGESVLDTVLGQRPDDLGAHAEVGEAHLGLAGHSGMAMQMCHGSS